MSVQSDPNGPAARGPSTAIQSYPAGQSNASDSSGKSQKSVRDLPSHQQPTLFELWRRPGPYSRS